MWVVGGGWWVEAGEQQQVPDQPELLNETWSLKTNTQTAMTGGSFPHEKSDFPQN